MAHLHAILAADAAGAVLVKRGPRAQTRTIGWDRRTDAFTAGQCIRKRIDHRDADLSPDGRYFIYYVNDHSWDRPNHIYRAVSRAPWLKAEVFWGTPARGYGPGVGLFFKEADGVTRIRAMVEQTPEWDHLRIPVVAYAADTARWRAVVHPASLFLTKLQRDGWTARTPWEPCPVSEVADEARWRRRERAPHRIVFDKPLGAGWALRQTHWCGSHLDTNRGLSWESFALVSASGAVERQPAWEWADVDPVRRRLVWTEDCVLHCAEVASAGLERARVLLDTRDMVFERLLAPY